MSLPTTIPYTPDLSFCDRTIGMLSRQLEAKTYLGTIGRML
ncbi:MAG TPA: hypothetical protein V6D09_18375 [Leptolyngbyaceae cyanobacterium]